jgi:GMP synthase (glutamine-hydrolysing)
MDRRPVLILDFGAQYTQLIARRIREQRVYCEIYPCTLTLARMKELNPVAVVLSGGPQSVYEQGAPTVDPGVFELGVPVLGICYGMQITTKLLGGDVQGATHREYGAARIEVAKNEAIFAGFQQGEHVDVWMSHGDSVKRLPDGFEPLATTKSTPFAAAWDPKRKFVLVQYHPEVVHTDRGQEMLASFLFTVASCEPTWTPGNFADDEIERIKAQIGPSSHAICGLSGGVDSSVAAVLVSKAIGDRLTCIFVDNGLLRLGEAQEVVRMFRDHFHLNLVHVDASKLFLDALKGITDPEQKRKTIGRIFIDVFDTEAAKLKDVGFLVQGTLYPDVIESVSFKGGPSVVIKTHHNVGGLPEKMKMKLCEPLRELFKDEVREVGATLGMPRHVLWRQPFPGPGLAIRTLGEVSEERLKVLREADAILDHEIREAGLYESLWQSFCVLLPVKTVGVMGDARTYEETIAIRAVESKDAMTATWAKLPYELLGKVSNRIINEVRGVNRVVYDVSSKPPATIEWE